MPTANYSFTGLLPGTYTIGETLQPGYIETSPLAAANSGSVVNIGVQDVPIVLDGTTAPASLGTASLTDAWNLTQLTSAKADPRFSGLNGTGETTAIIDTGINDLSSYFSSGQIVYQYDFADNTSSVIDTSGHGSNIASIIGSDNSQYPGLAPDAKLIVLKVFDDTGHGYFSYVIEALQWVADNASAYHIGVVNMSLGDGGNWTAEAARYGLGPVLQEIAAENIITVAAAGNSFYSNQSIGLAYPGSDPSVLAVGSIWPGDLGGPWAYSDGGVNYTTGPDPIAVYSQRDPYLQYGLAPGGVFTGAGVGGGSSSMQGTSQASAFMAGAATLAQELAQNVLGHQLSTSEFAQLLDASGDTVIDSKSGADNVQNTGLSYSRLDFVKLFDAIDAMSGASTTPPSGSSGSSGGAPAGASDAAGPGFATVTSPRARTSPASISPISSPGRSPARCSSTRTATAAEGSARPAWLASQCSSTRPEPASWRLAIRWRRPTPPDISASAILAPAPIPSAKSSRPETSKPRRIRCP